MMKQYPTREYVSDEEFKARYKKDDWKSLRAQVLKRDGYRCTVCGKGGRLAVHHTPEAYAMFGSERLEDLVTLCWKHHPKGNYSKFAIKQDRQASLELRAIKTAWRWLKTLSFPVLRLIWWFLKKVLVALYVLTAFILVNTLGPIVVITAIITSPIWRPLVWLGFELHRFKKEVVR